MGTMRTVCVAVLIVLLLWLGACGTSSENEETAGHASSAASTSPAGGGPEDVDQTSSPQSDASSGGAEAPAVGWSDVIVEVTAGDASDTESGVGPFGARVFYPAAAPGGEDAEFDSDGGPYPALGFGHGYLGRVGWYGDTLRYLAAEGYLVIAPTSQGGPLPDHSEFADELRASLTWLVEQGEDGGSRFSGAVDAQRLGLSGHSMGGGCALLAAARDPRIAAVSTLAAADTMPSSLDALHSIRAPVQSIAGSDDRVARPEDHQIPLFEAVPAPRQLVVIEGGSHCGFLDEQPPVCDSGSMPPEEQIELTRDLLGDWFGLYLKDDRSLQPAVWDPSPDPRLDVISDP